MIPNALDSLSHKIGELAEIYDRVQYAIAMQDAGSVRTWMGRIRQVKAELAEANQRAQHAGLPADVTALTTLLQLKTDTLRIHVGEAHLESWLSRPLPPVETLLSSSEGAALIADTILVPSWNLERDLVVLVGPGSELLLQELSTRGQQRLIVYCSLPLGEGRGEGPTNILPLPLGEGRGEGPTNILPLPLGEDRGEGPTNILPLPLGEGRGEGPLITAHSIDEICHAATQFPGPLPTCVTVKGLPGSDDNLVREITTRVSETLQEVRTTRNTVHFLGETWVRQGIANFPAIARWPSVDSLRNAFAQKPAVLVAPGPSLEKNIHQLALLKHRVLLIAVSRALQPLHHAGIMPDMVLMLDPLDLRYHFEGIPMDSLEALLLGATVHPEFYRLPAPRIFTFAGNTYLDDWIYGCLGDNARIHTGGSVAQSAFSLALHLGCSPVILVGQDLAFTDGYYYARTSSDGGMRIHPAADHTGYVIQGYSDGYRQLVTMQGAKEKLRHDRLLEVRGYHGGTVTTSFMFHLFRRWFEMMAAQVAEHVRLINATEGGAYIEGMEHLPLGDVIPQISTEQLPIARILDEAQGRVNIAERQARMHGHVRLLLSSLHQCRQLAQQCLRLSTVAATQPKSLARLEAAEAKLAEALAPLQFLSLIRQEEIRRAQELGGDTKDFAKNLAASRKLYTMVKRGAENLAPLLEQSLRAML